MKNVAVSAYQLVKLYKMFAMAEYYESRHSHGFWDNIRSGMMFTSLYGIGSAGIMAASYFWPKFDKEAKQAFDERAVLFRTVAYAFEHPGEILKSITAEQKSRYGEFKEYMGRRTLAGNYYAGVVFGGLLLDVLLILDGVTAIEEIATKIPGLLEMLPKLKELSPVLRNVRNGGAVADTAKAVPRKDIAVYDSLNPYGRPVEEAKPKADPMPKEQSMTTAEKGVFGEAKADEYMSGKGYSKLNGDLVQAGDSPKGRGIDGVWKNVNPPPEYVVTEAKYGTSQLSTLKDGTKQMSPEWVDARLDKEVGPETAARIRDADLDGNVERWVLKVDNSGNVTKQILLDGEQ